MSRSIDYGDLWKVLDEAEDHLIEASNLISTKTSASWTQALCNAIDVPLGMVQAEMQRIETGE